MSAAGLLALWLLGSAGCASSSYVSLRKDPYNPLAEQLKLVSRGGPKPTHRTIQLLRRYDLEDNAKGDSKQLLGRLQEVIAREPSADVLYSYAELAYIGGKRKEALDPQASVDFYGASVAHAYLYLFDPRFGQLRNPYDPEFRGACDLYNGALESALRVVRKNNALTPGGRHSIESGAEKWDVEVVLRGAAWQPEDFDRFEFVSDYQITGLKNQYHNYGLGVPLIAVRKNRPRESAAEKYYPENLSFPVTAFLRLLPDAPNHPSGAPHRAMLELYDPLTTAEIVVCGRRVPLESDVTTPLAYYLSDPAFTKQIDISTLGLLQPEKAASVKGLYMLEPYSPDKIPVLMVHGLWSSPITWMEMFNDLRSSPELRDRYQFWFYLYPSGQPFWHSAAQLREDLAQLREALDPQRRAPALDQMVLVGHSMGGLVSRLQTIDSRDDYWHVLSEVPFDQIKGDPELKASLEKVVYFKPNASVRRVITIGTPHRGSTFSNDTTRWLGRKLIDLPAKMMLGRQQLQQDNPGAFRDSALLDITTSIDSLSPESPILPVMLASARPPWVQHHNIVGRVDRSSFFGRVGGDGDGVVPFESAHLEDVHSEIVVEADHSSVHRHPLAVLEVRRILLEHLAALRSFPSTPTPQLIPNYPSTEPMLRGATPASFSRDRYELLTP